MMELSELGDSDTGPQIASSDADDDGSEEDVVCEAEDLVGRIGRLCPNLKTLRVLCPLWLPGQHSFRILKHFPHLLQLDLLPFPDLTLVQQAATVLSFLACLTNLRTLNLHLATSETVSLPAPIQPPLRLQSFKCINSLVREGTAERESLRLHLLDLVQSNSLQSYIAPVLPTELSLLDRLFTFTNLRELFFVIEEPQNAVSFVDRVLTLAAAHGRLRKLILQGEGADTAPVELQVNGSSSLRHFLYRVPLLRTIKLGGFYLRNDVVGLPQAAPSALAAMFLAVDVLDEGAEKPQTRFFALLRSSIAVRCHWYRA
jgi:hypothetical protein